jgi:hypothetical protein
MAHSCAAATVDNKEDIIERKFHVNKMRFQQILVEIQK